MPLDGISAHCKVDLATGELMFFNYSKHAPFMHYGVVGADNKLKHYIPVPLAGPRLPHDMAFTQNYTILNDMPLIGTRNCSRSGYMLSNSTPTRKRASRSFQRRHGQPEDIRWFEADPTYTLHWLNAWEEGDEIILDGYYQEEPMPKSYPNAPEGLERMMAYLDQGLAQTASPPLALQPRHRRNGRGKARRSRSRIRHVQPPLCGQTVPLCL